MSTTYRYYDSCNDRNDAADKCDQHVFDVHKNEQNVQPKSYRSFGSKRQAC